MDYDSSYILFREIHHLENCTQEYRLNVCIYWWPFNRNSFEKDFLQVQSDPFIYLRTIKREYHKYMKDLTLRRLICLKSPVCSLISTKKDRNLILHAAFLLILLHKAKPG